MAPQVQITVEPYGMFKARLRDFQMDLRISCKTDEQIAAYGFDAKVVSGETRTLFTLLTTFSETCDEAPSSFNVADLLRDSTRNALDFLTSYADQLVKEKATFRGGVPNVAPDVHMGSSS